MIKKIKHPIKTLKSIQNQVRTKILYYLDMYGLISPDQIYSEDWYTKMDRETARHDANEVSEILYEEFKPESVIDLGCGIGLFLHSFENQGCNVRGIEGSQSAIKHSVVADIQYADLRNI